MACLQLSVCGSGSTPGTIRSIIQGTHPHSSNIMVATSRTPDSDSYNDAKYAFREIGYLATLHLMNDGMLVPRLEFSETDVLATMPSDSTSSQFFSNWRAMGILPETHFVLFYIMDDTTYDPPSVLVNGSDTTSPSIDLDDSFFSTPSTDLLFSLLSFDFTTNSHNSISSSSEGSQLSSPSRSPRPSPRVSRASSPYLKPSSCSTADCRLIFSACKSIITTNWDEIRDRAMCTKGSMKTTLAILARNHAALSHIFTLLSLDPADVTMTNSFDVDGVLVTIDVAQVTTAFGWSYQTFMNKCRLYKKARHMATKREWMTPVSGKSC